MKSLLEVSKSRLMQAVSDEHPQTIAVVIACLPPKVGAFMLERLPPERQIAILRRVVNMEEVEVETLETVESEILAKISNQDSFKFEGTSIAAAILNETDYGTCRNILENLDQDDPEMVTNLKQEIHLQKSLKSLADEGRITINY